MFASLLAVGLPGVPVLVCGLRRILRLRLFPPSSAAQGNGGATGGAGRTVKPPVSGLWAANLANIAFGELVLTGGADEEGCSAVKVEATMRTGCVRRLPRHVKAP